MPTKAEKMVQRIDKQIDALVEAQGNASDNVIKSNPEILKLQRQYKFWTATRDAQQEKGPASTRKPPVIPNEPNEEGVVASFKNRPLRVITEEKKTDMALVVANAVSRATASAKATNNLEDIAKRAAFNAVSKFLRKTIKATVMNKTSKATLNANNSRLREEGYPGVFLQVNNKGVKQTIFNPNTNKTYKLLAKTEAGKKARSKLLKSAKRLSKVNEEDEESNNND